MFLNQSWVIRTALPRAACCAVALAAAAFASPALASHETATAYVQANGTTFGGATSAIHQSTGSYSVYFNNVNDASGFCVPAVEPDVEFAPTVTAARVLNGNQVNVMLYDLQGNHVDVDFYVSISCRQ